MPGFIEGLLDQRAGEKFELHEKALNSQMVRMLKTIGFNRDYRRGVGPYLFDGKGDRYLDLMSGWGVFALGRNHPFVNAALKEVLDRDLTHLIQMDVTLLSGLLAEALLESAPGEGLERVFFSNSGTEAVEGALKMAKYATGRDRTVHLEHSFHGLTMGSLSLTDEAAFRDGFGSMLANCQAVPLNDLEALDRALSTRDVAAFIVEPIQGKGVNIPQDGYLAEAKRLCEKYETIFIADEIQTGLGRTGAMWAVEHWGVEPDMILAAKALSGGQAPVGAIMSKRWIHDAVFNRMDRAVVHGSTFGKNNLGMAAGLATLQVLKEENLVAQAKAMGERLLADLGPMVEKYEFVKDVRGKGLMLAVEFGRPESLRLRASWALLEAADHALFSQMVLMPLLSEHRVLAQVAGHGLHVIKLLPPLVIGAEDCDWIVSALDQSIADCHRVPGSVWKLGKSLARQATAASA
ncbi:MAG: aminobacteriohopanetriol synthase HpnO [Rhodospirillales bacterium]